MVYVSATLGKASFMRSMPIFICELSGRYLVMSVLMPTKGISAAQTTARASMTTSNSLRFLTMKAAIFCMVGETPFARRQVVKSKKPMVRVN